MAKRIQHQSERETYAATVRFFLEVSRGYLANSGQSRPEVEAPAAFVRGRGYPSGLFTLLPTGRCHPFHPLQKQR
jgi:hypothetical protein